MRATLFTAVLSLVVSSGCRDDGKAEIAPGDFATSASPAADLAGDMAEGPPTFSADIAPIFANQGCLDCHMSSAWDTGETLMGQALVSYLTSTKSVECPSLPYITAGSPADSYLYQKVIGSGSCFVDDAMPDGSKGLDTKDANRIEAWIMEGAPAN